MKQIGNIPLKMKALVLHEIGKLVYEEVDNYKLTKNNVLVKIKYCGICSSDIERVFINGTYHFPTIPGHEMAGEVVCVNDEDVDLLGKRVCIFPMIPCMKCSACLKEEYAQCSNYNYFGSRCDGGFAEYLLVPKWNLVFFDNSIDYKVACLCEPTAVSLHALNIANVKKGDNIAINGAGTIGFLIAFIAKSKGANVTIVGRNDKKLNFAKDNDFNVLNVKDINDDVQFSKVFEVVGTNDSINQSLKLVDTFGEVILIGNPKEDVLLEKNLYWKILRKQLNVKGSWNSSYGSIVNDWNNVIEYMKNSDIPFEKVITREYLMCESDKAFEFLRNSKEFKLKVVLKNE